MIPPAWAGYDPGPGHNGTVTLIKRFGLAANLHVHLHRPVLYGVYRCGVEGVSLFIEVNASGDKEVSAL